jgi:hypothetical protein
MTALQHDLFTRCPLKKTAGNIRQFLSINMKIW